MRLNGINKGANVSQVVESQQEPVEEPMNTFDQDADRSTLYRYLGAHPFSELQCLRLSRPDAVFQMHISR